MKRHEALDPERVAPLAAVVFAGLIIRGGTDTYQQNVVRAVGIAKQILAASAADFDVKSPVPGETVSGNPADDPRYERVEP